jgi:hypothetical protein
MTTNKDGALMDCRALPPVEQSMGAHSAPLGLAFTTGALPAPYRDGALVGIHGSWNRKPPQAPEVSFFAWRNGGLGGQQTLVGGFQADDGSGGGARSRRWWDRTARSTSPTTTPALFTGWRRRGVADDLIAGSMEADRQDGIVRRC